MISTRHFRELLLQFAFTALFSALWIYVLLGFFDLL